MPEALQLEPGIVVADRFSLRRAIGEGGMGWIWEAVVIATRQPVALKFLKGVKEDDRRRFLREARAAAAVRHPNVLDIHEVLELPSGMLVMVMDLLEGEALGAILKREARIALPVLAAILLPVIGALKAAHAVGIVHRDLKPDNIFLSYDATGQLTVKVLDFGVAKLTASEGLAARTQALTETGSMVGTPYYMSPEQVLSEKDLDQRADIWSLGVVMYECLSGVRPTEGDTVGRVLKRILNADFEPIAGRCDGLPEAITALIERMLVGDRDRRIANLDEVADVLARYAAERIPAFAPAAPVATTEALADTVLDAERPISSTIDVHPGSSLTHSGSRTRRRATAALVVVALGTAAGVGALRAGKLEEGSHSATSATATTVASSLASSAAGPTPGIDGSMPHNGGDLGLPDASAPAVRISASSPLTTPALPRCAPNEVLSQGHCCARGLVWQGSRCERPLATTF